MNKEDNELLLDDLCARLPYGVMLSIKPDKWTDETFNARISTIDYCGEIKVRYGFEEYEQVYSLEQIKPYLFPLSSMTEEQKSEINRLSKEECDIIEYIVNNPNPNNVGFPVITYYMVDWCNKNHFDYRGLIPKGLANDATGLNIY